MDNKANWEWVETVANEDSPFGEVCRALLELRGGSKKSAEPKAAPKPEQKKNEEPPEETKASTTVKPGAFTRRT